MENLNIEQTESTPSVRLDAASGVLELRGESYPENTAEFYAPVFKWLRDYLAAEEAKPIRLQVEIVYFNSSSSKVLMNLFDLLSDAVAEGKKASVDWIYDMENESALEYGEEFKEDLELLEFNLVAKDV